MKEALKKIEEEFFTQVSKDDDLQAIKARGELNMEEAAKKEWSNNPNKTFAVN